MPKEGGSMDGVVVIGCSTCGGCPNTAGNSGLDGCDHYLSVAQTQSAVALCEAVWS